MSARFRLGDLAERLGAEVVGDPDVSLCGVATLDTAGSDQLSFFTNTKYRDDFLGTSAGAVLVGASVEEGPCPLLRARDPYAMLADVLELFHPAPPRPVGVSERAAVDESARLGRDVHIGPFAVVEAGVELDDQVVVGPHAVVGAGSRVGARTDLRPGVVLYPGTRVGADCLIHSGVVLGADGFGFATVRGEHRKVPQVGRVRIEDRVEIGANSTVDRAAIEETVVGEGTKIDDLVMLAHGVRIGRGSLLAAQVGIAGSTVVGAHTMWGGQSGAAGHLDIPDGTLVGAKSAVFSDPDEPGMISGVPAGPHARWLRVQALVGRLPEMRRELREMKRRLAEIERTVAGTEPSRADD